MAGEIYRLLDRYDYVLPVKPPDEEILYYDLPQHQQYWRREEWNLEEINKKWTDAQKNTFVKTEIRRRIHGFWFFNNGTPTYITGSHYFFLQYFLVPPPEEEGVDFFGEDFILNSPLVWSFTTDGMMYPQFRRYQKEFFYYLDLVAKTGKCEGGAVSKPRRVGVTACFNGDTLNQSSLKHQKKFSLMNKDGRDVLEVNYDPIKYNINHWPSIKDSKGKELFKPQISKLLTKKLHFGSSSSDDDESRENELNNHIYVCATVENANDGTGTYRLIRDEISKYPPDIDISNMHFILRPVARVGTRQVGKIFFFGTSEEKDTKNFERWKIIYWDSDITNSIGGVTASGLYNYFISGKYAIEGKVIDLDGNEVELFDRYGECKEDLAVRWIYSQIQPFKDKGDLKSVQAIRRQYPIFENDPFDSTTSSQCYDSARINAQLVEVEKREKRVQAGLENPFESRGDFEWVIKDKEVRFVPFDPDKNDKNLPGAWIIYEFPNERWRNKNYRDQYDYLNPNDTSPYLWTADPTAYREYIKEGSKASIFIGSGIDSSLPNGGESQCARYLHRPLNPNDIIENVRMGIIYYAAKGCPETNKEWLAMDLIKGRDDDTNKRPNYGRFILTWDKNLKTFRQWRYGETGIAGIYSGEKFIEAYIRDTNIYLKEIREKNSSEIDRLYLIWDKVLLEQWRKFDPMNTTKFDLAVTGSMWCTVLKNYRRTASSGNGKLSDSEILKAWFGIKEKKNDFAKTRVIQ